VGSAAPEVAMLSKAFTSAEQLHSCGKDNSSCLHWLQNILISTLPMLR
jgi:hypothetical protein